MQKRVYSYVVSGQGTAEEALNNLAANWQVILEKTPRG